MQELGLKVTFGLNNLTVKSGFNSLEALKQENRSIAGGSFYTFTAIQKVFYIKASTSVRLKITNLDNTVQTLVITDCFLISGAFTSVRVENLSAVSTDVVEVFAVIS
jgi:hypothetical protein